MKKTYYLLSLLAAMVLLPATTVFAQSWTASAPANGGSYYLYNVGYESFVYGANNWNTRVSLTQEGGIPVTLIGNDENSYYISTAPTYANMFMGADGYLDKGNDDSNKVPWSFTEVEGLPNTYILKDVTNNKYIAGRSGDATKTTITSTEPNGNLYYWKLVTKENLKASLSLATEDNPIDATWAIQNPYFGINADMGCWEGVSSVVGRGGENDCNKCVERWNKTSFDVYQTLTDMPNGIYELKVQGFYRMGGGDNTASTAGAAREAGTEELLAKYYINDTEAPLKSIFDYNHATSNSSNYNTSTAVVINGTNYYVPNNADRTSYCFLKGEYWNDPIRAVVTDGTIRIGVKKSTGGSNDWATFDTFVLTYLGPESTDINDLLAAAKLKWHTKYDPIVNQALDHSAFDAVIDGADEYCTTIEALNEYETTVWNAVCDLMKNGTTATGQFDITSLLNNPTLDTGTNGWTITGSTRFSDLGLADFYDVSNARFTQTLPSMPAGDYTYKVQAFYRSASEYDSPRYYSQGIDEVRGSMVLGSSSQPLINIYDQSRYQPIRKEGNYGGAGQKIAPNSKTTINPLFVNGLYWNVMNATTSTDGDLTVGLKIENGLGKNWMVFDNFRLYYGATSVAVDLTEGLPSEDTQATTVTTDITLNAGEYNKVCLPFSLDATQTVTTFTGVYFLAGVKDGVGQLVPVNTIEAGKPYFVTVGATKTLSADNVMVSIARPDSVPVMWEGAATVGTFDGYTFNVNPSEGVTINSYAPVDFQNMDFTVNQENWYARRYLNEFTYTEEMSSKIDYYNLGNPARIDQPHSVFIPVPFTSGPLTVTVSVNNDYGDGQTIEYAAGTLLCEFPNLIPQNTYYYKVESSGSVISKGQFNTEGRVRMIKANTGFNIRDLGGRMTESGNRIKYGKVFRGGELDYEFEMNASDLAELRRLGIAADLDWRRNDECGGSAPTSSVLSGSDFLYMNHDYADMNIESEVNRDHYKQAFNFMLNYLRDDQAVYFHCRIGADRTGVFAMLIEGLCGMTYDQLCKDYEMTSYSIAGTRKKTSSDFNSNYNRIKALPGNSMQEKFFYFWYKMVGIDVQDIFDFVEIMTGDKGSLENSDLTFLSSSTDRYQDTSDITAMCSQGSIVRDGKKAVLSEGLEPIEEVEMSIDGIIVNFESLTTTLEPNKDYTLTIPAYSIEKDGVENASDVVLTFTTPILMDGVYYFRNTDPSYEYKYISRGGKWSTQAIMGNYGVAAHVNTSISNETTIRFFENDMYLGDDGFCYTDCTGNRIRKYTVSEVEGGYKFLNRNNSKYLAVYQNQVVGDAVEGDNLEGVTNVWAIENTDEHKSTCYTRNTETQVAAAATAAGLSDITTVSELEGAFLYASPVFLPFTIDRTSAINQYGSNEENGKEKNYFSKSITGLENGLYKLSFKGLQLGSTYERVDAAEGARSLIYAYANDAKTQLKSGMDESAESAYANNYYSERTGMNYPNDDNSTFSAFDEGRYENSIYVYVTDGTINFGINNPSRLSGDFDMKVVYGDFTLTYFYNDLSLLVSDYEEALAAAKTTSAKTDKMAPSLHTELDNTIITYDEGNVDKTNKDALDEATIALKSATQKCETSLASYAIILSGGLPNNSVDGWAETNRGDLKINTWSNESNGDGGSGFDQPFIENWLYYTGGFLGEGKLYYHLEGLEPGDVIHVELLARACTESGNAMPVGTTFYANESTVDFSSVATFKDRGGWGVLWGTVSADATVGDDGVLEFGLETSSDCNYNWHAVNNVKFEQYYLINQYADYNYAQTGEGTVKLSRTINADKYNAVVLPFDMTQAEVEEYFGEGAKVYLADIYSPEKNHIYFVLDEGISANVPCLLYATKGSTPGEDYVLPARTLAATEDSQPIYYGDGISSWGNYNADLLLPDYAWFIQGGRLVYAPYDNIELSDPCSIYCTRAYFMLNGWYPELENGAKALSVSFGDDDATGIAIINNGELEVVTGKIYDLSGREVSMPRNGIYVINGKKVLIK